MIIPHRRLSPEALRGLIEEFVTRHGTDGGFDASLDNNVAMVIRQLDGGDAFVVYDMATETANRVPKFVCAGSWALRTVRKSARSWRSFGSG